MRTCPKCGAPVADTEALGGTYVCSKDCGWWIMHEDAPDFGTEDREAGLGQKSENRVDSGHGLTVSDEEMAAAAAAFDEFDSGCGQDHDPEQWKDKAQWRATLSAAYEVRMQRLAEEAAQGFSEDQIGEPRPGPGLGDYVRGLIERARGREHEITDEKVEAVWSALNRDEDGSLLTESMVPSTTYPDTIREVLELAAEYDREHRS